MTQAFHFPELVWDWPIAIYLFLIGVSAGLVMVAIYLRRSLPEVDVTRSPVMLTTLWLAPASVALGLIILILHLTRPLAFWKLMFHYSFTSVMSMGVMLFQLYMLVLALWLAMLFRTDLLRLLRRWLPPLAAIAALLDRVKHWQASLENIMLLLAALLGAYTGFLLSALKACPLLNNPVLPVLFLFSGLSSGIAVAMLAAMRSEDKRFMHRLHWLEKPVLIMEVFLLLALFVGMLLGDEGKLRALHAAMGGGFWTQWFWWGVVGVGFIAPLLLRGWLRRPRIQLILACSCSLLGVLMLRFFILYAGQMTVA
ncbi:MULTISPECIES: cytochrome c nitrite reductase subunit NrfD [Tenebrionibacter/Tenebrionicola group]|jgi:protein NrfD|uniref:Cytochrome c nitrite reductase subunit NrfD n=2 Tax=Tenebrionibacter/Tenebrionicola group TaxID=2969848 RepID=A0A8K0V4A0_9ENTR|nr:MULTISPECIES: cytochrome c nitrite reductase subunit NrfD [Tenebrionibacter/Tenebrionicola group]MBK4713892.1 cytochrome c nitrite reductase subunit NrfD [Tenebrionibacter intestinalis]MBV4411497.1 cytochrome c nitrite reductase subunit NrfD [Tenebrionicola larvae]MBV5096358.1 cytochrome c nitrite reductase subunit NrfD [Tenebrionicola larvae]